MAPCPAPGPVAVPAASNALLLVPLPLPLLPVLTTAGPVLPFSGRPGVEAGPGLGERLRAAALGQTGGGLSLGLGISPLFTSQMHGLFDQGGGVLELLDVSCCGCCVGGACLGPGEGTQPSLKSQTSGVLLLCVDG